MGIFSNFFGSNKSFDLDVNTFSEKIKNDKNAVILDVRTKEEFLDLRIPNSELIDIYKPDFLSNIEKLDRSKNYYIYCRSGNRSYHAGRYMLSAGFKNVCHLEPGIIGWDGPIEK